jgi:hypothetical protein
MGQCFQGCGGEAVAALVLPDDLAQCEVKAAINTLPLRITPLAELDVYRPRHAHPFSHYVE